MPRPDPHAPPISTPEADPPTRSFRPPLPSLVHTVEAAEGPQDRYETRGALGKGSMGEVLLCHDARVGREVAMKVIAPKYQADPHARARFVREVRVQGQLEHPAIVPVYDLGVDARGASYFTMKCLRGATLADALRALAAGDEAAAAEFPRRRLLSAFAAVCRAVDYAHARGVVHRDLKPANIMLGGYGEVYVLDWGIARTRSPMGALPPNPRRAGAPGDLAEEDDVPTATGKILGTWGYMSPEQARGRVDQIDARSDVYSLGAVLFEILALAPLHKKDVWNAMLMSTVQGVSARASDRVPDVAPELDRICVKATCLDPAERYQSARELEGAVERYLEGDRDEALRRQMAASHARAAGEALGPDPGAAGEDALRAALSEVGRALAIQPDNAEALRMLGRILAAPARGVPPEVAAELDAHAALRHGGQLREAIRADLAGVFLMTPVSLWMGVRSYPLLAACIALTFAAAAAKYVASRQRDLGRMHGVAFGAYVFNLLSVICLGRSFGPLFFTPMLLTAFTFAYCMTYRSGFRAAIIATGAAGLLGSVAADVFGLLPRSYAFHDGAMTILPMGVTLSEVPTEVGLTVACFFMILVPGVLMGRMQNALREAEQRSFVQAFRLRRLLPDDAPG